ncbi:hypothetical protein FFI97_019840 [Variovorax sp. KBS0712]|uniref:DUF6708 domain-containing protein n=1 Tax=Variovorax sp. KBS0712 TaxID=2578111 RepID=UPI001117C478|nr:DUF6708 domain-containing protein [Variovorax sp. KBS0712]TSD56478.1 hypothetical protein FFI97_019840 [Variovorax sp. KBS0712]
MSAPEAEAPPTANKLPIKKRIDVLRSFGKTEVASIEVTDLGLLKRVYARALQFGGVGGVGWRGMPASLAALGFFLSLWTASLALRGLLYPDPFEVGKTYPIVIYGIALFFFSTSAFLFLLWVYTATFFLPSDDSVIFDRGNRKVHWVSMQLAGKTRRTALKRPVIEVRSVDWDLVDAEHRVTVKVNTASASRDHDLAFIVHKSATDATVVDEFGIAPSMLLGETTVPALWEHIRRYMEEDGPPLPPGVTEPSPTVPKPRNWWQSMGLVGPFGPKYLQWWRKQPGLTLAAHALLPLSLPIYLAWGTLNWLTYATEQKVHWPQDVLSALGPSLDSRSIEASKGDALQPMRAKG